MAATIKQKRLEGIIRRDISEIIQYQVHDPNANRATVTDVKVSNDHSYATVYVTFYGANYRKKEGLEALNRASGFIRSMLAQQLDIRRTPQLTFKIDETEEKGRRIDEILDQIHEQEADAPKQEAEAESGSKDGSSAL